MPGKTWQLLPGEPELSAAWAELAATERGDPVALHAGEKWGYLGTVATYLGWVHVFVHPSHPENRGHPRYKAICSSPTWRPRAGLRVVAGGLQ